MKGLMSAWLVALVVASFAIQSAAQEDGWFTKYEDAVKVAKEKNLPILADFTGTDWCIWCKRLKAEVFDKDEFKAWAKEKVVLLEVDFPRSKKLADDIKKQNDELKAKFKITGFPTLVYMDAEGQEIGRGKYVKGGPTEWIKKAEESLKGAGKQAAAAANGPSEGWMTSYKEALAKAKKEKKLVLADFTGSDWCSWCSKLKTEVFDTPEFKAWAEKNVVLLEIDFPRQKPIAEDLKKQNEELQKEFKVDGYPTILFLDSSGKKKGKMGYEAGGPKVWIEMAQKLIDKAKR